MLAFENDVRQEIENSFQKELVESRDLLRLALDMLGSDGNGNLKVPSNRVTGVGNWARSLRLVCIQKHASSFVA